MTNNQPLRKQPNTPTTAASQGSVVMLTLAFLLAMTLQVLLLGTVVNRTLGTSAVTSTQAVAAKEAADTGIERLNQALLTYAQSTTPVAATILTAYGSGGPSALTNVAITVTNPETGASSATPVTYSAYVGQARGSMYELVSTATYRDVKQTSRKWVQLDKCQYAAGSSTPSVLLTNPGSSRPYLFVDQMNDRAIISDTPTRTLLYRNSTLLTTLLNTQVYKFFLDRSSGRIFFETKDNTSIYQLNPDNSLVSIPSMAPVSYYHGNLVVNPSTGELFTYRYPGTVSARGLWKYNPTTATATQLVTLDLASDYTPYLRLNPNDGRIFIFSGHYNDGTAYTWANASGLTTLPVSNIDSFALNSNDSRAFFHGPSEIGGVNNYYTWGPSTGLSTLINSSANCGNLGGASVDISRNRVYITCQDKVDESIGRIFSWDPSVGLTTITTSMGLPTGFVFGSYTPSILDGVSGSYFFPNLNSQIIRYDPTSGLLSTLPFGNMNNDAIYALPAQPLNAHPLLNSALPRTGGAIHDDIDPYYVDNSVPTVSGYSGLFATAYGDEAWLWTPSGGMPPIMNVASSCPGICNAGGLNLDPTTGTLFMTSWNNQNDHVYQIGTGTLTSLPATGGSIGLIDDNGFQNLFNQYHNMNFNTGRLYFMKGPGSTPNNMTTIYTAQIGGSAGATCD